MKILTVLLLALPMAHAQAHFGAHKVGTSSAPLPDHKVTPGVADPDAVADLSGKHHMVGGVERNLCADDFRTPPIRSTIVNFAGLKKKVCAEYGVEKCDGAYEGDHLISIENGGCKDCLANLWPQPADDKGVIGFHTKDVVENRTHKLICEGKITLKQGQQGLAVDWYQFAKDNGILPEPK